jgi:hypothetical protein
MIFLSSDRHYNNLRAYYYRVFGGALLVPDKAPARPRKAQPEKMMAKTPAESRPNTFSISGLDPTVGPQISVLEETKPESVTAAVVETSETTAVVESNSTASPQVETPADSLAGSQ